MPDAKDVILKQWRRAARPGVATTSSGDELKVELLFFDQMDFLGQLGLLPE
jgi:hypothetical protein